MSNTKKIKQQIFKMVQQSRERKITNVAIDVDANIDGRLIRINGRVFLIQVRNLLEAWRFRQASRKPLGSYIVGAAIILSKKQGGL